MNLSSFMSPKPFCRLGTDPKFLSTFRGDVRKSHQNQVGLMLLCTSIITWRRLRDLHLDAMRGDAGDFPAKVSLPSSFSEIFGLKSAHFLGRHFGMRDVCWEHQTQKWTTAQVDEMLGEEGVEFLEVHTFKIAAFKVWNFEPMMWINTSDGQHRQVISPQKGWFRTRIHPNFGPNN